MHILALGGLALADHAFGRPKPLLVATYLTLQGPTSRRRLAELFWPDAADARDSLGTTVRRLNALAAEPLLPQGDPLSSRFTCDVAPFQEAVTAGDATRALALYEGPFLADLNVVLHEEVEEWVYANRERFASMARWAHLELAERASARDDLRGATRHAEGAMDVAGAPPWPADAMARLLGFLQQGSSARLPEAESLAVELGVAYRRTGPAGTSFELGSSAPRTGTSFVGRRAELAEVDAAMGSGVTRLLTLHGPAGAGKSRLAAEWASRAAGRALAMDGTIFVRLETVGDAAMVPMTLASAMQLVVPDGGSLEYHIVQVIGTRRMLIVLDNFEHVLAAKELVATLVRSCPNLLVLLTSRVTLDLAEEHVLEVEGLPLEGPAGQSDAKLLLLDRMRQHDALKRMTGEDELAMQTVCRLVDGSPLALELAAAQTRVVPLAEVAAALELGIGTLVNLDATAPARQQSVHAALDVSWELLGPTERRAAARLAVFRGGFARADAKDVAGVESSMLARFLAASLLRHGPNGRYEAHPMIGHYLSGRLLEDEADAARTRERHARHYLSVLAARGTDILGGDSALRLSEWLEQDFANLRAAQGWALEHQQLELLDAVALPLAHFAELRGRYGEVVPLLEAALHGGSQQGAEGAPEEAVPFNVLGALPFPYFRLGRYEDALEVGERALRALDEAGTSLGDQHVDWGRWGARQGMGLSCLALGRLERARALLDANVSDRAPLPPDLPVEDAFRRIHDVTTGTSLMSLATVDVDLGRYAEALVRLDRASALFAPHDAAFMGYVYWMKGRAHLRVGDTRLARDALEDGLEYAHRTGFRQQVGHLLTELGAVHLVDGHPQRAEGVCRLALEVATTSGDTWLETVALARLGLVALRQGRALVARERLDRALELASRSGAYALAMEAMVGCALLLARGAMPRRAATLLAFVGASPLACASDATEARGRLADLEASLAPVEREAAMAEGAALATADAFAMAREGLRVTGPRSLP